MNARTYRGTWLLVGIPVLVAAFSVSRADPLPAPTLPPTFDQEAARLLTTELATQYPDRSPGSARAAEAARWVAERFRVYGFRARRQAFAVDIPGRGRVRLTNLVIVAPGRSDSTIVVSAHRDNLGTGRGANDNATGTAALIELARTYARRAGRGQVVPAHRIVFLSTDGGAFGSLGAAHFAAARAYRGSIAAVVSLDALAGDGAPRLIFSGDEPRSPSAGLVQTAATRVLEQTGEEPRHASALVQLVDLAFPFSLHEQAPFVARGIPAVTLTRGEERPEPALLDSPARIRPERIGALGRSAQQLLVSLDQGVELPAGGGTYVYFGPRIVPGWALELVLVAAILPFLSATVDLFARCRRRRIPLAPALRSYRRRILFWLVVGGLCALFGLAGAWPEGVDRPLAPETAAAARWPVAALVALGGAVGVAWLITRERLLPRQPVGAPDQLAGYTAALLVLAVLALLVIAVNAFLLLFLLPSLHAWLWLPQLRERPSWLRFSVLAAGFAGPVLLVASFATRFGLGLDAPWYIAALVSVGYVESAPVLLFLVWLAAAAQLTALAANRYAPYPAAAERPPRGLPQEVVRRLVLALRRRHRASELDVHVAEP